MEMQPFSCGVIVLESMFTRRQVPMQRLFLGSPCALARTCSLNIRPLLSDSTVTHSRWLPPGLLTWLASVAHSWAVTWKHCYRMYSVELTLRIWRWPFSSVSIEADKTGASTWTFTHRCSSESKLGTWKNKAENLVLLKFLKETLQRRKTDETKTCRISCLLELFWADC